MGVKHIALVGNPNAGKTTIFNLLTGLNQKVGNYPGVTVDKKIGSYNWENDQVKLVDLPGTYSLQAKSEDELIVKNYLNNGHDLDLIVVVADASNLERNLLLFTQIYDMNLPVLLVLNMIDVAEKEGFAIDADKLSELLGGLPVLKLNARNKAETNKLKEAIHQYRNPEVWQPFISKEERKNFPMNGASYSYETSERFKKISNLLKFSAKRNSDNTRLTNISRKLDSVFTHKVWGFIVFTFILFIIFQAIFEFANWPMDLIDVGFVAAANWVKSILPSGILTDLIADGLIPGLGGVIIFIPQIALLFLFLTILEETGYMTRVVFIMDRLMRPFGLSGKSVVPIISGAACAVPAIMSTRSIDQPKDRLITILVTPLISCSARLPVYTLMIALTVPETYLWDVINVQGLVLLCMYILGTAAALLVAILFKWIIKPGAKSFLIMEMPLYKMPQLRNVGLTLLEKVKVFVFEAGKIIVAISIILWVLGSYGPDSLDTKEDEVLAKVELDESFIGIMGKAIEPAITPLGYDWKIGISLITSFAAREVFVGTMATIYSIDGADETSDQLLTRMRNEIHPVTGEKVYGLATGISLMIFYAFAMQCMSTLAIVKRETKSWKWPLVQLGYLSVLAYLGAFIGYNMVLWFS